jgi:hypothetical protein
MSNKKKWIVISLLTITFLLAYCTEGQRTEDMNEGKLSKSNSDITTLEYTRKSKKVFVASLDFELTEGKVDWEIVNPKNKVVFKGYVIYEDGKVYRELTYPLDYHSGRYRNKEEVNESFYDASGNLRKTPDFSYLQFEEGSMTGKYKLILKPIDAEGSYEMVWNHFIPRK